MGAEYMGDAAMLRNIPLFAKSPLAKAPLRALSRTRVPSAAARATHPWIRSFSSERRLRPYTRTGDKGTSSLYSGQSLPKNDKVFEALGHVDELNCSIGVALSFAQGEQYEPLRRVLHSTQCDLMDVAASIATPQIYSGSTERHDR